MPSPELSESLKSFLTRPLGATLGNSVWAEAFRRDDLSAALSGLESELQANPSSLEIRIWWILVQLQLGKVPLGALASPLVELLPSLKVETRLAELGARCCLGVAVKLAEKGQFRLGASLAEAALDLGSFFDDRQRNELQLYVISYLEEELSRAQSKRENKDYLKRLEKRLEERRQEKSNNTPVIEKRTRPRKNSFDSKALFEQALKEPEKNFDQGGASPPRGGESPQTNLEGSPEKFQGEASFEPFTLEKKVRGGKFYGKIIAAILLIVLGLFYEQRIRSILRPSLFEEPGFILAMRPQGPKLANLVMPNVELSSDDLLRRKMQTINSSLAEVGERLKNLGEHSSQDSEVDQKALETSEQQLTKLEKKSEDELVPLDNKHERTEPEVDPKRTPRLNPDEVKNVPVEDLGQARPPREDNPRLKVGPDGRLYGPPADRDAAGNNTQARALDGSPLRSYAVEDFQEPKHYRTIVATNVLSAPSLLSVAMTRLEANTSVQVVSRMGQWLELRSSQGRRGYIFAQDAVEADGGEK